MSTGTYTSPKRVERKGVLVAFEGEVMTMEEAERRELVNSEKVEAKQKADASPNRKDLIDEAEALGIVVPSKATKDAVAALIADKQAELAAASVPDDDAVASGDGTSEAE